MVPPRPVQKSSTVKQQYTDNTYRDALEDLLRDFLDRCAYSLVHRKQTGPDSQMHVEHFDPTLVHPPRNHYSNLNPAHSHCNLAKRDFWPDPHEVAAGWRLLNPCAEVDYGEHIFEDPETHLLVATSPAGRLQIDTFDLNNRFFVEVRADRADLFELGPNFVYVGPATKKADAEAMFRRKYDQAIPLIPPPPEGATLI
jgi:hypothetical protein